MSQKLEKFDLKLNSLDINKIQDEIIEFWDKEKIFEKSVAANKQDEATFYDGPPFPTGKPHHGTVLVSFLKDMLARYITMQGKSVPRRWGWDCHGLPIETQAEKLLGISNKCEIEERIGIEEFNNACASIVSQNNDTWKEYITAMARWVDYDDQYKTLDTSYMESVIWVFKECYDRGLIYQDYRVVPYCCRCETSLSISDTRESDSTRPRQDPSVTIRFKADKERNGKPTYFLAWTTTPWTLSSNLALAVGPELDYVILEGEEFCYILSQEASKRLAGVIGEEWVGTTVVKGAEFIDETYEPLFPYFAERKEKGAFRVIGVDYVELGEGTGIVHTAPGFGEEDYWACRAAKIDVLCPVDEQGCYIPEVTDYAGRKVLDCNSDVIRQLKEEGKLLDHRTIDHNYPHCWRCREPLIYKAMTAWYFDIEKIKDKLIEQNNNINWVPAEIRDGRFGKWLDNARDWNISRNRYWSTPLPIWECDSCDNRKVLGSIKEIEEAGGMEINDLHRQHLDKVEFACDCGGTYKRIPDVLDCWFESGSMPYAQCHYPFENKEWFEAHFPADFIVEYTGQIRCWFYYLHVLAVALFDRPAFKNCVVHGTVLAADGKKLSKSSKNYEDPLELMHKFGTDAFRMYMFNSNAALMGDLLFDNAGIKVSYQKLVSPLWNACSFFTTYANIDGYKPGVPEEPVPENTLDIWILSRLYTVEKQIKASMDVYIVDQYVPPLLELMDDLTNWYIRRSRRRFWGSGMSADKSQAFNTLHYVLVKLCELLATGAPIISEYLYKVLTGEESVHLAMWPDIPAKYENKELMEKTRVARKVINMALSLRRQCKIKNRQPLARLDVVLPENIPDSYVKEEVDIIAEELNIKKIDVLADPSEIASVEYLPNFKTLGPKYGKDMKSIAGLVKQGKFISNADGSFTVNVNGNDLSLEAGDVMIQYKALGGAAVVSDAGFVVGMDTNITPELEREGMARELIRHIQEMRKEQQYDVSDRIIVSFNGGDVPSEWLDMILSETLAEEAEITGADGQKDVEVAENVAITVSIKRK